LFCGAVTAAGAFLGRSILIPVTEVGSLCSALGWLVTCVAYARSHPRERGVAIAWIGATVAVCFVLLKLVPQIEGSFSRWEYLSLGLWLLLGFLLRSAGKKI